MKSLVFLKKDGFSNLFVLISSFLWFFLLNTDLSSNKIGLIKTFNFFSFELTFLFIFLNFFLGFKDSFSFLISFLSIKDNFSFCIKIPLVFNEKFSLFCIFKFFVTPSYLFEQSFDILVIISRLKAGIWLSLFLFLLFWSTL